ncbi:MAG TPA: hypothetical protein VEB68_07250 [Croceibacterium sp.]|nr:hypothetical protein [Croceibacterium sp.]
MVASLFRRLLVPVLLALAALAAGPARAEVAVTFHSFSGSFLTGRYPHAFVAFDGTLDDTGEVVHANYGFSARTAGPGVLAGPVAHGMYSEKEKYVRRANRHFTITVPDATYRRMMQEMAAWRDAPGKYYDLDTRNCIHFVGRIAELGGLRVDYPRSMLRHPKAWLNHIAALNPQLGARPLR